MSRFQRIEAPSRLPDSLPVPGSKSLSHRALLLAHHCQKAPALDGLLICADTEATRRGMAALGGETAIDCGNSGTSLRLLLGQAALLNQTTRFVGDTSLSQRANGPLLDCLQAAGVWLESREHLLPITICGPLRPGRFSVAAEVSSQFLSSLLLALPFADGDSQVHHLGPVHSQAYVDLTLEVAAHFGLVIERTVDGFQIPGNQKAQARPFAIEGDWSSAGLAAAVALAAGQPLRLENLQQDSRQSDRCLPEFLEQFGARCRWLDGALSIQPGDPQSVPVLDLRGQPDLFPPMAVLASLSPGPTRLRCSPGIRHKESDRLMVMAKALDSCGLRIEVTGDDLIVIGGQAQSAALECSGDHRIHMALCALAATVPGGLQLDSADAVDVSWPGFHRALNLRPAQ